MKSKILFLILCVFTINMQGRVSVNCSFNKPPKVTNFERTVIRAIQLLSIYCIYTFWKGFTRAAHWFLNKYQTLNGYTNEELYFGRLNSLTQFSYEEEDTIDTYNFITNVQDFLYEANQRNMSRKDVVLMLASYYNMYRFPQYINGLIDDPVFEEHIKKTNRRLKFNKEFYNILANAPGYKKGELCKLIEKIEQAIIYNKKEKNWNGERWGCNCCSEESCGCYK